MRNGTTTRVSGFSAGLVVLVASGWFLTGQAARPVEQGYPTDWSHHHVVFSQPANSRAAARVARDARYWQQFARRNVPRILSEDGYAPLRVHSIRHRKSGGGSATKISRDWSVNMGSGASMGADNYAAKYTFSTTTATCGSAAAPDFVVLNTGLTGSSTQASIVAYDNLYSGCSGTVPQTFWAYNTSGKILTSVTFSQDGTQVAFAQSSAGQGQVVLLKWKASNGTTGTPVAPTNVTNSLYRGCTAPCMTTIVLRSAANVAVDDQASSVFPDYQGDTLYVGGALGWLHKITGVFVGSNPQEVHAGGFPVQVNPSNTNTLYSPVFDGTSVFVGDAGGFFYRVNASTGAVVQSAQLDHGTGIVSGPYLDGSAGLVYVFASSDGTANCAGNPCSAVYVLSSGFAANATGTKVTVGSAGTALTPNVLYAGDFDSTYQNSTNATGNLYVCGNTGGSPTLYQIPIAAGVPGTAATGPVLASATTGCSPITDVYNPGTGSATEWIFLSVQNSGKGSNCGSGGCVFSFINTPRLSSHVYAQGQVVLDSNFQVQVVATAGTSGAAAPTWSTSSGGTTTDGTVQWFNQGAYNTSLAPWAANTAYAVGDEVIDNTGQVEQCTKAGTSNSTQPSWTGGLGGKTAETGNGPHWTSVGAPAISNAFAAGGTSGIILDNTVPSTTLQGASQIYFSTQSNQNCTTSGSTGGCAIQASQSALK
ncbi:MAG TPA: hypothetical protein VF123_09260 [Candidatus Sulfotelmatobacter sp.]